MPKILEGARVIDPQVGLDAVANIYIRDGRVVRVAGAGAQGSPTASSTRPSGPTPSAST